MGQGLGCRVFGLRVRGLGFGVRVLGLVFNRVKSD